MKTVVHLNDLVGGLEESHARIKECLSAMPASVELPQEYAALDPLQLAAIFQDNVESLLRDGTFSVAQVLDFIHNDPGLFLSEGGELQQVLLD